VRLGAQTLGPLSGYFVRIDIAETDAEILACFPVMQSLRNLEDPAQFLERVRFQQSSGYRIAALRDGGEPLALAGFRIADNLAWGRFLYIDDLVTLPEARSKGYGSKLLAWLSQLAKSKGAQAIHLESGTSRTEAHRFYAREGFEISSFHFKRTL